MLARPPWRPLTSRDHVPKRWNSQLQKPKLGVGGLESKSPFLDECEIPDTQSLLDDAIGTAQEATVVLAEKLHETFHAIGEHTPDAPEWNIERLSDKKYIAVAGQSHGTQTVNDTIARANSERDRPSNAAWPF